MADLKSNPFKQAAEKKKKAPGAPRPEGEEIKTTVPATETPQEPQKEEQVTTTPPAEEKPVQTESVAVSDVVKMIQSKKKENRDKGPFTYYLLKDNDKKLLAAAKKAGLSKSDFLDQLLTEILK